MQLKTILNRVEPHKSFVYGRMKMIEREGRLALEAQLRPRANGRPICSGCRRRRPGYDRLPPRRFEFVPLWGIAVFFVYAMRRVECPACGVTVEEVPWGDGNCRLTRSYRWFLARWARRMSWQEVAVVFHTSWEHVRDAVKHAVFWGILQRNLRGVRTLGVELLEYNLESVRAHLQREDFQRFWEYRHPTWAGKFLDEWCQRVMRSRLGPMKKVARTLREHRALLLNWFRAGGTVSAGTVEGFNNKAKLTLRKAYGFREFPTIELALFHQLGALPEPQFTHEFC
jgi:transposase